MSRFLIDKYKKLNAYVPGEQPRDMKYVKLNTNESPYPPTQNVISAAKTASTKLNLYSDPYMKALTHQISSIYNVPSSKIMCTNGSDEALNFIFDAFCSNNRKVAFPDITYGFYSVFAQLHGADYTEIPLKDDFSIDYRDYCGINRNIIIANPNAPTGLSLPLWQIEEIIKSNPDNLVTIDEAYIDFGGESAVLLTAKYDNLAIVRTFSKSKSMAGARLGFAVANEEIIKDLETLRFSTNPYNVNAMTQACGIAALQDNFIYANYCKKIIEAREKTKKELRELGFDVIDSDANFLFIKSDKIDGKTLYTELKKRGVLVRHFDKERIKQYNRISIGTPEQMKIFISTICDILGANK